MSVPRPKAERLAALRAEVAAIATSTRATVPFAVAELDDSLARHGLEIDVLHEVAPASSALADDAAATLFLAGIAARLARHAQRHVLWVLTPVAAPSAPDGIWLDLTGSTHLFGGEERFCRKLLRYCGRLGFSSRVAVAGTPGAAHALARYGRDTITIVGCGGEAQAIAPLPLAALRLEPDALAAAARFGIDRVADLLAMPRGPLARRLPAARCAMSAR